MMTMTTISVRPISPARKTCILTASALAYHHSGNKQDFARFYLASRHLVLGCVIKYIQNRDQALDLTSDIFMKLMQKLRESRPLQVRSWLYRVTINHCLAFLRQRNIVDFVPEEHLDVGVREEEWAIVPNYTHEEVRQAIGQLPEGQRQCIDLFFLHQYRYKEISEELHLSAKEVKSYIQNGKRRLKQLLQPTWTRFKTGIQNN